MNRIRTLIADDYSFFRRSLKAHLEESCMSLVSGVAANGPEAVALAAKSDAELMIMKLRLPGFDGLEASRRMKTQRPDLKIILYTDDAPEIYSSRPGYCADACVSQDALFDELPRLIQNSGKPLGLSPQPTIKSGGNGD